MSLRRNVGGLAVVLVVVSAVLLTLSGCDSAGSNVMKGSARCSRQWRTPSRTRRRKGSTFAPKWSVCPTTDTFASQYPEDHDKFHTQCTYRTDQLLTDTKYAYDELNGKK